MVDLPTYYDVGTASVANGATTVTGSGTGWAGTVYAGDLFMDPAQPLVPPQRIATVTDSTHLVLAVAWPGTSMTSDPYEVRPTPDGVRIQERTRQVLNLLGNLVAADVPFTPAGSIAADDLQVAIEELDAEKLSISAAAAAYLPLDAVDARAPRHVAGRWYAPMPLNTSANSAFGQNVIGLQMFTLGDTITIDQLGTYVSTLSAGGNLQLAIYANDPATGLPTGQPLLKTGNISTAATGTVSAAVVANAQLTPGLYWMAAMMDNAVAAVVAYQGAMPLQPFFSGSATLTNIASSSSLFDFVIRVTNTFASGWPDLTSATKTVTPGTLAPVVFFRTASVP